SFNRRRQRQLRAQDHASETYRVGLAGERLRSQMSGAGHPYTRPMALGPRTDLDVFGLNLGCNVFGWTASREESYAVLDAYVAAGGNFLATADVYMAGAPGNSGGESETIIGEWLAARGRPDGFVIATKVGKLEGFKDLRP